MKQRERGIIIHRKPIIIESSFWHKQQIITQMRYHIIGILLLLCFFQIKAQTTTNPTIPIANQELTITFNSALENRLGLYTSDLYAHTGVSIEGKGDWQKVIGEWGNNQLQPKLNHIGNGVYQFKISPNINTYFGAATGELITKLCIVFRSSDGTKQTNDIFIKIYQPGLTVAFDKPGFNAVVDYGSGHTIGAISNETSKLTLKVNGITLKQENGTTITSDYFFGTVGECILVALAENNGTIASDTIKVFVRTKTESATLPSGSRKGISYINNTTARLVLWAPRKQSVFAIGDFNNWKLSNEYQLKKDGDFFWIDITGLNPGEEYAFQYLVDGEIKIADPYTSKTLDPWHDEQIMPETYPDLKPYPKGKTEGIASVLQTAQEPFKWATKDFKIPDKGKMVIYELLVRDFTHEHTFASITKKLDYLKDLRVNVIELMPVNEFEGNSGWGYNPSFYFATDKYYGPSSDLKKLIDECHKRGIAVVIDMVLNHSYGQCPFVQLYSSNATVTADNPWYNQQSNFKNNSLVWGHDFNHENTATQELIDSINSYWINEFNVDGFRFDFTKGFSNTPYPSSSWGSEYDAPRIANLKRMANEIWKRKPNSLVICEHLTDNVEERELADHGLMLWGNMNHNYAEAAMGYNENGKSDLTWGYHSSRGFNMPNLVSYQESHDEERVAYKCQTWGNSTAEYDTKELTTTIERLKMNAMFHILIPGPKMIWQFGELAYDYTIDHNGRLGEKPVRWDYTNQKTRSELFHTMASLNHLKQSYEEFSEKLNSHSLYGAVKSFSFSNGNNHVVAIGNFDVLARYAKIKFPAKGTWYDYFNKSNFNVDLDEEEIPLLPGEFALFSTKEYSHPTFETKIGTANIEKHDYRIYPNPTNNMAIIKADGISRVEVFSTNGERIIAKNYSGSKKTETLYLTEIQEGLYFIIILDKKGTRVSKLIKTK